MSSQERAQAVQLLEIPDVKAIQVYDGEQVQLASETLSVELVSIDISDRYHPTSTSDPEKSSQHQDYSTDLWLVLNIGPDFSLPVPASQTIRPERSSSSYVLPSHEIENASIRLFLPPSLDRETVKRFDRILSQYSAFEDDDRSDVGQIELMDDTGQVVGTLMGGFSVKEDPGINRPGHNKDPVLIDLPPNSVQDQRSDKPPTASSLQFTVSPVPLQGGGSDEEEDRNDWLLKGADYISRGIIKTSSYLGNKITEAATSYTEKSEPVDSSRKQSPSASDNAKVGEKRPSSSQSSRAPMRFKSSTLSGAANLHSWSGKAVQVSSKTTGAIIHVASGIGDTIGRKTGIQRKRNPDGTLGPAPKGIRGVINRSLIAANTVLDGIDAGAQTLLYSGGEAASTVVGHKYGTEAKVVSDYAVRTGKNVFLVYKDLRGVRRTALLKVAGGSLIKARMDDGREVILSADGKLVQDADGDDEKVSRLGDGQGRTGTKASGAEDDAGGNGSSWSSSKNESFPTSHSPGQSSSSTSAKAVTTGNSGKSSPSTLPPPPQHPSRGSSRSASPINGGFPVEKRK
ncbi:hypothetical protein IE53DRAFT_388897 [Violaceomyces palustris]|uniref:Uncharacterized protein n=1 Tax=Violaceomyces palustris TaxID=1673888 RepID=A0ACD0NSU2_9BASI|nr:hypothetical protein IE53DRAFT_388897 [Violaceomyces palustris]